MAWLPEQLLPTPVRQSHVELEVRYCVGGVVSPILSNIYLHKLDEFAETVLVPQYTRGEVRERNPAYSRVRSALVQARRRGDRAEARKLRQELRRLPVRDPCDPGYRRLRYSRYADLSRSRDNSAYAEDRIMPRTRQKCWQEAGILSKSSA